MTEFTPWLSLIGGGMIGLAAVLLMATHGRIAGISGIVVRMLPPYLDKDAMGRVVFIVGLIAAPSLFASIKGGWPPMTVTSDSRLLVTAGLLVGFGSIWGNGCTSGHGICGLSRLSLRSLVAVGTFMTTAISTVYVSRHMF